MDSRPLWHQPPVNLPLAPEAVHLWRVPLDQPPDIVARLWQTLAADERARAERFAFTPLRQRFIVARGALRDLLSRYTGEAPDRVALTYGAQGKPALVARAGRADLHFNLSHSESLAVYAVTRAHAVGVDVEHVRPITDRDQIAQRFFAAREVAALRALPPERQLAGFFACWTRKEAYIKARGEGLALPLSQFAVAVDPDASAALLWVGDDPLEAARWSLGTFAPEEGYAASLAVRGHGWQPWYWQFPTA